MRHLVATRHGQMHVRVSPGSGKPLLALHMSPLSGAMWVRLMDRLSRPVIAPDRIGFGFSDAPVIELTMDDYAAATLDALDALHFPEFDVLGEHTGSVEAVAITHIATDRVGCVGLVGVPAYSEAERRERLAFRGAPPKPPVEDGSHLLGLWRKRLAYRTPPYDLDVLHRNTVAELISAGPERAYRAVFAYPMMDRLSTLERPAVVFAPHDDLIAQTERARSELPPRSTYVDLPDLSLDVFDVAADRMATLVTEYLGADACN